MEIRVTRRLSPAPFALTAAAMLLLTGCVFGGSDPRPSATPPPVNESPGASSTQTAAPETTDAAETAPVSTLSCPGVMAHDAAFDLSMPGWGLKEQVAVTGGTFQLDKTGATGTATPIDRGLSCSIYGSDYEVGVLYSYVETSDSFDAFIADLEANNYTLTDTPTPNVAFYRVEGSESEGHGFDHFAAIGDGWAVVGWSALDRELNATLFTGEYRDVDPNDYVSSEQATLGCSMFLGEQLETDATTQVPILQESHLSLLRGGENALTTNRDPYSTNFDVLCDQVVWHEGEVAPDAPGDAIASTPECEIYQRGERDYLADCGDAGYAEVAASDLTATQVRTPAFRGFDE